MKNKIDLTDRLLPELKKMSIKVEKEQQEEVNR